MSIAGIESMKANLYSIETRSRDKKITEGTQLHFVA